MLEPQLSCTCREGWPRMESCILMAKDRENRRKRPSHNNNMVNHIERRSDCQSISKGSPVSGSIHMLNLAPKMTKCPQAQHAAPSAPLTRG
ncbi:hypothetical protein PROFUN_11731 [Planoprotostelium fungivorum]|uniref:Uncharacterized protein n=1 Tax=Planoprotostelium fungivorum TaxID=1890364 RepID=A0A2P6MYH4_9EUKA|nr:hypothetical protein PROFUN_11731 [Planoprotostelium fungivorum]